MLDALRKLSRIKNKKIHWLQRERDHSISIIVLQQRIVFIKANQTNGEMEKTKGSSTLSKTKLFCDKLVSNNIN